MSDLDQEGTIVRNLAYEVGTKLALTERLIARWEAGELTTDDRAQARAAARHLALEGRIGFVASRRISERMPVYFERFAATLRVSSRLAYCLLALADEEPEPFALLGRDELDTLLADNGADELVDLVMEQAPAEAER
jgi:hypothetical protein